MEIRRWWIYSEGLVMGKNRYAYNNANGNLVYYSDKEGMIAGKSGGDYRKAIASTLRFKRKKQGE